MNLRLDSPVLSLAAGQLVALDDARGTRIQPREGTVWITEEGEARDFVVGRGESHVVRRGGRTLVQAIVDSRVALRDADPPGVPDLSGPTRGRGIGGAGQSSRRSSSIASP